MPTTIYLEFCFQSFTEKVKISSHQLFRSLHQFLLELIIQFFFFFHILPTKPCTAVLRRTSPTCVSEIRPLRSSGTRLMAVGRVKCEVGEAAFSFYAPSCWNTLSDWIISASLLAFKRKTKKHLLFSILFVSFHRGCAFKLKLIILITVKSWMCF